MYCIYNAAVAVERGTTARQRIVFARLGDLQAATSAAEFQSPTLIVIGEVVALGKGWKDVEHGKVIKGRQVPDMNLTDIQGLLAKMGSNAAGFSAPANVNKLL